MLPKKPGTSSDFFFLGVTCVNRFPEYHEEKRDYKKQNRRKKETPEPYGITNWLAMRRFYRTLLAFAQRERHFGYALVLDSFFLDARSTFSGHLFILQDLGSHQPRSPTACMVLNSDESHALRHCAGQICGETLQFWMAMGLESDLDISLSCTSLHLQTMFY